MPVAPRSLCQRAKVDLTEKVLLPFGVLCQTFLAESLRTLPIPCAFMLYGSLSSHQTESGAGGRSKIKLVYTCLNIKQTWSYFQSCRCVLHNGIGCSSGFLSCCLSPRSRKGLIDCSKIHFRPHIPTLLRHLVDNFPGSINLDLYIMPKVGAPQIAGLHPSRLHGKCLLTFYVAFTWTKSAAYHAELQFDKCFKNSFLHNFRKATWGKGFKKQ